jgi:hypothetical protein
MPEAAGGIASPRALMLRHAAHGLQDYPICDAKIERISNLELRLAGSH